MEEVKYKIFLSAIFVVFGVSILCLLFYISDVYPAKANWTYLNDLFFIRKYHSDPALYFTLKAIEIASLFIPMKYFDSRISKLYGVIIIGVLISIISYYVEVYYLNSILSYVLFAIGIVLTVIYYWIVLFSRKYTYRS